MVVQDNQDEGTPSSAKCEYSSNQTNIHSQIRLAKSMTHVPTEADFQHPPKRPKTNVNSSRPLCIIPGRPPTPPTSRCIDLTTVSHSRPPDLRQPAPTASFTQGSRPVIIDENSTYHRTPQHSLNSNGPPPLPTDRPPEKYSTRQPTTTESQCRPSDTNNHPPPTPLLSTYCHRSRIRDPTTHARPTRTSPSPSALRQNPTSERSA